MDEVQELIQELVSQGAVLLGPDPVREAGEPSKPQIGDYIFRDHRSGKRTCYIVADHGQEIELDGRFVMRGRFPELCQHLGDHIQQDAENGEEIFQVPDMRVPLGEGQQ